MNALKKNVGLTFLGYPSGVRIRSGIKFPEDTSIKKTVKAKGNLHQLFPLTAKRPIKDRAFCCVIRSTLASWQTPTNLQNTQPMSSKILTHIKELGVVWLCP